MKDFILKIVLILVGMYLMFVIAEDVIRRHEKNECLAWQGQSEYLIGYYFADWQKAQCAEMGVIIE